MIDHAGNNTDRWLKEGNKTAEIQAYANMTRTAIEEICLRTMELDSRREVGVIFSDPKGASQLSKTFEADWGPEERKEQGAAEDGIQARIEGQARSLGRRGLGNRQRGRLLVVGDSVPVADRSRRFGVAVGRRFGVGCSVRREATLGVGTFPAPSQPVPWASISRACSARCGPLNR